MQQLSETGDVGRNQHAVSRLVRVTLTNYDTRQTVYALWTNADEVLQQHQGPSHPEPLFLPCTDNAYEPATDAVPVRAPYLATLAFIPEKGNVKHRIRLNQRFRAASGPCFYPGMSLAQVMCVASSGEDAKQLCFEQEWDESASEPVVICDGLQRAYLRVMAFHKSTVCAAYAQAWLPPGEGSCNDHLMVTVCDSQYDIRQPSQVVTMSKFWHQAGCSAGGGSYYNRIFTTQALQLPCGNMLLPGTCFRQVVKELNNLKSKCDRAVTHVLETQPQNRQDIALDNMADARQQRPADCHILKHMPPAGDSKTRQHGASGAVRVHITNYNTHQTVYALWTNAYDILEKHEVAPPAEPVFLPCTDDRYLPSVTAMHVSAAGLAKMASFLEAGSAKHRTRLSQRIRAASGHCFYAGMSVAQVMCVISSDKDVTHFIFGRDWDETEVDPVISCSTAGQTCVRMMACHTNTLCALYVQVWLSVETIQATCTLVNVCDSQYNVEQPQKLTSVYKIMHKAGFTGSHRYNALLLTQSLLLPSRHILLPGTSLHQVMKELDQLNNRGTVSGGDDDVPAVINTARRKQESEAMVNTSNAGKKRTASSLEQPVTLSTHKKVAGDRPNVNQEQDGYGSLKWQAGLRHQGNEKEFTFCESVVVNKQIATVDGTTAQVSAEKTTNTAEGNKKEGSPIGAATTVVVQPFSPVSSNTQQHPPADMPTPQQLQANRQPPTFPKLDIQGDSIHPLSVIKAWSSICSLLRYLNCSNDAVKQMWSTRQQWRQEGEGKMHHFAMSYAELASAVQCTDWEYAKQILQQQFQLPV